MGRPPMMKPPSGAPPPAPPGAAGGYAVIGGESGQDSGDIYGDAVYGANASASSQAQTAGKAGSVVPMTGADNHYETIQYATTPAQDANPYGDALYGVVPTAGSGQGGNAPGDADNIYGSPVADAMAAGDGQAAGSDSVIGVGKW